jgi:hypothetical protein
MEVLAWLWWLVLTLIGLLWTVIWFLISGWVSTFLQLALLVIVIYFLKYGWQRAPAVLWTRTRSLGAFAWSWLRAREPSVVPRGEVREVVRVVRTKEFGDMNVSTMLSLLMLGGLLLLGQT